MTLIILVYHLISLPKETYWDKAIIVLYILNVVPSEFFVSSCGVGNMMDLHNARNLFRDPSVRKFILFFILLCQCIYLYLELIAH